MHLTSILSECFWAPSFQTNRISRRINKLSENLTSLSIFDLNIKPFLWKYHILPTLFWAAQPWNVYSPEQNGVFCDCLASFQLAKTFILKLKCSAFIRNTSFTDSWKGRLKNWVFVLSVRILVPSGYWATYCTQCNFWHRSQGARAIHQKFQPVRPGKVVHLLRWTSLFETFPVGTNLSIEFWTEFPKILFEWIAPRVLSLRYELSGGEVLTCDQVSFFPLCLGDEKRAIQLLSRIWTFVWLVEKQKILRSPAPVGQVTYLTSGAIRYLLSPFVSSWQKPRDNQGILLTASLGFKARFKGEKAVLFNESSQQWTLTAETRKGCYLSPVRISAIFPISSSTLSCSY